MGAGEVGRERISGCRHPAIRSQPPRQITTYLLPGDISDLDGVILGYRSSAIATLSPCSVVQVPAMALLDLVEGHPVVTRALRLAKMMDEAITRTSMVRLGRYSASERIAHLFCELVTRLRTVGRVGDDGAIDLPLTQSALGDTLGLSSVHMNRSLQFLRQEGWITLEGRRLHIVDWDRLRAHAEFEPAYLDGSR